jgi:hypothetical protein
MAASFRHFLIEINGSFREPPRRRTNAELAGLARARRVYNLWNLWRRVVLPKRIDIWSLTSVQQRLVKTARSCCAAMASAPWARE